MEHITKDLTLKERLSILQSLSPVGNYEQVSRVLKLANKVKITEEEEKEYELEILEGGVRVPQKYDTVDRKFKFTQDEIDLLKTVFTEQDSKGGLSIGTLSLYEKFVLDKKNDKDTTPDIIG